MRIRENPHRCDVIVSRKATANIVLSIPMLWGMAAGGGHLSRFSVITVLVVIVIGGGLGHWFIGKIGPSVKAEV